MNLASVSRYRDMSAALKCIKWVTWPDHASCTVVCHDST